MTCCFVYASHSGCCDVTCWSDSKWNISLLILLKSSLCELVNVWNKLVVCGKLKKMNSCFYKTYYYLCCWRLIPPMHWIKTKQIYFHELIWVLCMDSAVWIQWYLFHFLTANLKQVLIFAYLKQYDRLKIVFDWLPEIDESRFSCCCLDWLLSRCRRIIEFWYAHLFCGCWWCWLKKTRRSHRCVILY